jgi:hypothetical protein
MGYVRLNIAWRERQPEMLEFAVTTGGIVTSKELFDEKQWNHIAGVLFGVMLIESCGASSLKVYRRVPATNTTMGERQWSDAKPQQRLIALI